MQKIYSPNMLKTFKQCPQKFYFRYIKNINMPIDDEIFEFGKNIHALASYYLKKENMYKMENSLSEKEKNIWTYLKSIDYFSYETINTEYNISVKIDNILFGGRLDALVKKDNTYYILDYKTGTTPQNAKHDYQTMIYLLAVSDFFKTQNVVFVYIDLKNKLDIKIELSTELISEYKAKLNKIVKDITSSEFKKIKNKCNCEYAPICY